MWTVQLYLFSPQSWFPVLSIMPASVLREAPEWGRKDAQPLPSLPGCAFMKSTWISSPLGVTLQVSSPQGSMTPCVILQPHMLLSSIHCVLSFFEISVSEARQKEAHCQRVKWHQAYPKRILSSKPKACQARWLSKDTCTLARRNKAA